MPSLSASRLPTLLGFHNQLYEGMAFKTVETAAQELSQAMFKEFRESVVLARMYLTVPFKRLQPAQQAFARKLASSTGSADLLTDATPVLTLTGTAGINPDWNDRRRSVGHVAIPLLSTAFVDSIPMVARVMNDMGLGISWIDKGDTSIFDKVLASRVFYVPSASEARDHQGRMIVPAQDFVRANGVTTVFGVGGSFIGSKTLAVLIVFTNEIVPKDTAQWFSCVIMKFIASAFPAMQKDALFLG